jgi:hypothetical protein
MWSTATASFLGFVQCVCNQHTHAHFVLDIYEQPFFLHRPLVRKHYSLLVAGLIRGPESELL